MPSPVVRPLLLLLLALPLPLGCGGQLVSDQHAAGRTGGASAAGSERAVAPLSDSAFARTIATLSEPGGYFDSDNLVSNEASYLHVLDAIRARGVGGGAYVGVGPDQSFSYIAALRPEVAYLIDVRRDNLLFHLLYKALFAEARNRAEYLLLFTGRAVPRDVDRWSDRPLDEIVALVAALPRDSAAAHRARELVRRRVQRFGVALSAGDLATTARIHDAFITEGLELRFTSLNRPPRTFYPTLRQLLLETDRAGRQAGYLNDEASFRSIKQMQADGRIIPVVGNLSGDHALAAIGRAVAERGLVISALYVSNVEFYLMRAGTFDRFAATVAALPRDERSVLIRSCFGYACRGGHPHAVPGHFSVQILQGLGDFAAEHAAGGYRSYRDVVERRLLPPE